VGQAAAFGLVAAFAQVPVDRIWVGVNLVEGDAGAIEAPAGPGSICPQDHGAPGRILPISAAAKGGGGLPLAWCWYPEPGFAAAGCPRPGVRLGAPAGRPHRPGTDPAGLVQEAMRGRLRPFGLVLFPGARRPESG
jgi:hypothetical protein